MDSPYGPLRDLARPPPTASPWAVYALLLAVYAAGLTHGLSHPWIGLHDWNGAFFSQLARNLLRYPLEIHGGMPLVAVGEAVPPPEERSIYATHPAGLVWLVAGSFVLFGETEWAARLVPIVCSLGALVLLVRLVAKCQNYDTAWLTGLLYATMPLAVYFGRMVNHEPVGVFFMLAALTAWTEAVEEQGGARRWRWAWWPAWAGATWAMIWVDWSGLLFTGLMGLHAVHEYRQRGLPGRALLGMAATTAAGATSMLVHLVYAGLSGRWADLWAIFLSRSVTPAGDGLGKGGAAPGAVWDYTVQNLTWPMILAAAVGLAVWCLRRHGDPNPPTAGPRRATCRAARVLPATGLLWLVVFWRQYELHNYWLFYLGPVVAWLAANGVLAVGRAAESLRRGLGGMVRAALLVVLVGAGMLGVDQYFSRTAFPPEETVAWAAISARTRGDARVLLFRNPVRVEERGEYVFRNIVPPQVAFYLDRRFAVESSPAAVAGRAEGYAGYVIPIVDAIHQGERLAGLRRRFSEEAVGSLVWFDLGPREGPDGSRR